MTDDFPVPNVGVVDRIANYAGCDGIEMNVRDDLAEVVLRVNDPGPVSALPESSEISSSPIDRPGHTILAGPEVPYKVEYTVEHLQCEYSIWAV